MGEIIVGDGDTIVVEVKAGIAAVTIPLEVVMIERPKPRTVWDRDISGELATNDNCPGSLKDGWWQRRFAQIVSLTFHHTLSHSPWAFAKNYIRKGGGRPTVPYTIWITETGQVLLCIALTEGCWSDHTGHKNVNLSVGLAGTLHIHHPSDAQLDAAARVAMWAIKHEEMRVTLRTVRGHMDVGTYKGRTECPGWASKASGYWKAELFNRINALLGG